MISTTYYILVFAYIPQDVMNFGIYQGYQETRSTMISCIWYDDFIWYHVWYHGFWGDNVWYHILYHGFGPWFHTLIYTYEITNSDAIMGTMISYIYMIAQCDILFEFHILLFWFTGGPARLPCCSPVQGVAKAMAPRDSPMMTTATTVTWILTTTLILAWMPVLQQGQWIRWPPSWRSFRISTVTACQVWYNGSNAYRRGLSTACRIKQPQR